MLPSITGSNGRGEKRDMCGAVGEQNPVSSVHNSYSTSKYRAEHTHGRIPHHTFSITPRWLKVCG